MHINLDHEFTDGQQNVDSLLSQREWFRVTLASIGDAVIATDTQGRIMFLNSIAQSLTGWTEEDARGARLEHVFKIINEKSRLPAENPVAKVLREGAVVGLANHTVLIDKHGTERPIDDSAAPIKDENGTIIGVVMVFRDMAERRQAEEASLRLAAIVESSEDAIIGKTLNGIITSWNSGAERLYGYTAEEIKGKSVSLLIPPDHIDELPAIMSRLQLGERVLPYESVRIRKDGTRVEVSVTVSPIKDAEGRIVGASAIARDITERKAREGQSTARLAVTQILAEAPSFRDATPRLLKAIGESLKWDMALLWTIDQQAKVLKCQEIWHCPSASFHEFEAICRQSTFAAGIGLPGRIWASGKPAWIPDVVKDANFPRGHVAAEEKLHGAFGFPIQGGPDTLGVMEFFSVSVREPDVPLLETMATIGSQIGQFMERKRAEENLQESEARKTAILKTAVDCIITINQQGKIVEFNPAAERTFGYSRAQVMGQPMAELIIPPSLRAQHYQGLAHYLASGKGPVLNKRIEMKALRADGTEFPVELAIVPISTTGPPLFTGHIRDISERKQSQEALQASERRFRSLVEKSWDAYCLMDAQGTIGYVSPPTTQILGYALEDLIGRNAFDLIHPDDLAYIQGLFFQLLQKSGSSLTAQHRFRHLDGSWRWLETTGTNLLADPNVQAVVANYRDITEHKRMEGELLKQAQELHEANRRKDEFLAVLAHELRNPLAPIRNALEIMKLPAATDYDLEKLREMMERQVQHMTRMVNDLLDVSRITSGKIQLRKEILELAPIIHRAVEAVGPAIEAGRHDLTVSPPSETVRLEGDSTRLEQVLVNLLTNSAKFSEPGGHIELTARHENQEIVITIRDAGIGIAPEMVPHVFDLFLQGERGLDRTRGGLGIGLTLVRRLVELHGGTVQASSAGPGRGSEFMIRLPALTHRAEREESRSQHEIPTFNPTQQFRILVVDDNVDAADSMAELLRLTGQKVAVAYDGLSALNAAQANPLDIIFLDIGMPKMNGLEVARRLRQHPGLKNVLLVALTGWGQKEDRRRSQEAGFDLHLVKPVEPAMLQQLLADPNLLSRDFPSP